MEKRHSMQGFTLVEALVALFILTVGILSLYSMQVTAIQGNQSSNRISVSSAWAQNQIESVLMTDMDSLKKRFLGLGGQQTKYLDRTQDGQAENHDPNRNGFDDDGVDGIANFGLDAATVATADWNETSPDRLFNIYYNFAIDLPFPRVVTVRVLVQDVNSSAPPTVFTYIKDDTI